MPVALEPLPVGPLERVVPPVPVPTPPTLLQRPGPPTDGSLAPPRYFHWRPGQLTGRQSASDLCGCGSLFAVAAAATRDEPRHNQPQATVFTTVFSIRPIVAPLRVPADLSKKSLEGAMQHLGAFKDGDPAGHRERQPVAVACFAETK